MNFMFDDHRRLPEIARLIRGGYYPELIGEFTATEHNIQVLENELIKRLNKGREKENRILPRKVSYDRQSNHFELSLPGDRDRTLRFLGLTMAGDCMSFMFLIIIISSIG